MSEPPVLRSDREGILELVLNRPEKLNALNEDVLAIIAEAAEDLRRNDDLRVLLIRSTGRYFSSGVDLNAFKDRPSGNSGLVARSWFRRDMAGMHSLWQELELIEKPVVVAHHAMCAGGALEMSLSCDFRLAAASAGYWFPEMKMGMVPASGGISRMTRLCGPHWAKWMMLANKKVDAQKALTMGLVHEVYPDETFEQDVWEFCRELVSLPKEACAIAKMTIELAADLGSASARQVERLAYSNLISSDEQAEMRRQHHRNVLKS